VRAIPAHFKNKPPQHDVVFAVVPWLSLCTNFIAAFLHRAIDTTNRSETQVASHCKPVFFRDWKSSSQQHPFSAPFHPCNRNGFYASEPHGFDTRDYRGYDRQEG
jgi:hypothetical protein